MEVLLVATSESAKLQPITNRIPAPLMPIANRPLMLYPLELLARQGCKQINVALFNHAGHIESYFGTGERWGVKLQYILQRGALGDGGSAKQAFSILPKELLLVVPADEIIDFDLDDLVAFHNSHESLMTALVSSDPIRPGRVLATTGNNRVCGHETDAGNGRAIKHATGVYLLEPELANMIPTREHVDIYQHLLPRLLAAEKPVFAYENDAFCNPLATFQEYQKVQTAFLKIDDASEAPQPALKSHWPQNRNVSKGIWIGRHTIIHPNVQFQAPVTIGDNCYIGQGVQLGPGVVIGDNVIIDEEATLAHSTVMNGTYVGKLIKLENRLVNHSQIVDFKSGEAVQIADEFLVGKAYQTVSDTGLFQFLERCGAFILLLLSSWLIGLFGLGLWLATGRGFKRETYYHGKFDFSQQAQAFLVEPIHLWQLVTYDRQGGQNAFMRWLTRWQFYRLPHLWHVVTGEIALVGVKPLTQDEIALIKEEWQQRRFRQVPGVTGLWFVQTLDSADIDSVFIADTYYSVTQSWQLDLKILWQTLPAWLRQGRKQASTMGTMTKQPNT